MADFSAALIASALRCAASAAACTSASYWRLSFLRGGLGVRDVLARSRFALLGGGPLGVDLVLPDLAVRVGPDAVGVTGAATQLLVVQADPLEGFLVVLGEGVRRLRGGVGLLPRFFVSDSVTSRKRFCRRSPALYLPVVSSSS